jgi:hypothetical protein
MAAVRSEGLRFADLGGLLDCLGFALDTRERVRIKAEQLDPRWKRMEQD